jgi:prepilin-type N-terminal cleavage/methylation domain-containing protein
MKIYLSVKRCRAMTLIEVLMVLAVLLVLAALLLPQLTYHNHNPGRSLRIQCVNNLKQDALAARVWEGDNNDKFPWALPATNNGTLDFISGPNAWRHFQIMSNELSTPKVLICPTESYSIRPYATNFIDLNNSNLSFFVGTDAKNDTNPQLILFGDHNLTNGTPVKNGILEASTNHVTGWTAEMHKNCGNVALADGSVQQVSSFGVNSAVENTGLETNRLQMPILSP